MLASTFMRADTDTTDDSHKATEFEGTVLLNTKYRYISVIGTINEERLMEFQNYLWELQKKSSSNITCLFNGSGGALSPSMAMHDLIKVSPAPIITIATGDISSATLYIFLAGTKRLLMPHSRIRFHHAVGDAMDDDEKEAKKTLMRWRMHNQRIKQIIKENSTLPDVLIKKYLENFTTLTPTEAIHCGLAHEIIHTFPKHLPKSKKQ